MAPRAPGSTYDSISYQWSPSLTCPLICGFSSLAVVLFCTSTHMTDWCRKCGPLIFWRLISLQMLFKSAFLKSYFLKDLKDLCKMGGFHSHRQIRVFYHWQSSPFLQSDGARSHDQKENRSFNLNSVYWNQTPPNSKLCIITRDITYFHHISSNIIIYFYTPMEQNTAFNNAFVSLKTKICIFSSHFSATSSSSWSKYWRNKKNVCLYQETLIKESLSSVPITIITGF